MEIKEPVITREDILKLSDPAFNNRHVCIVTGCAAAAPASAGPPRLPRRPTSW